MKTPPLLRLELKRHVLALCASIFFCAEGSFAQSSYILDSLKRDVRVASHDTARISALCKLSNVVAVFEQNDSVSRTVAQEALDIAQKLPNTREERNAAYYQALALQALGVSYRYSTQELRPVAEQYFQVALQYARDIPNEQRSLQMQAVIRHSWFTSLRFRIDSHFQKDRPLLQLQADVRTLLDSQHVTAEKLGSNALRGQILLCRAFILTRDISQKILLTIEAVKLYEQSPDVEGLATILSFLGFFSQLIGDDARAMTAYKRVVSLAEANNLPRSLAIPYQAIGDIYAKLIDTTKALEYYLRAEPYTEKYDVKSNRVELLQKIGTVYLRRKDIEKASPYFERAIALNNDAGHDIYTILYTGQLYRQMNKLHLSRQELERGRQLAEQSSATKPIADFCFELATTYQAQANAIDFAITPAPTKSSNALYHNTLDTAFGYARRHLAIIMAGTPSAPTPGQCLSAYSLLYEISKERGQKDAALQYLEQLRYWEKSVLSTSKSLEIAAMESRAVVEAAEAKVQTLEAQDKLQRAIGLAIAVAVIALVLIIGLLYRRNNERRKTALLLEEQNHLLSSKNEQLEHLNAEKTTMMGIVAHDLKNPIAAVRNLASLILADTTDPEATTTISTHIVRASNQMLDLVINLLDNNRLEEGAMNFHIVAMDIAPSLESIVQRYQARAAEKSISLVFTQDGASSLALVDELAVTQVFDNIISNALKYSPHGKNVFIRLNTSNNAVRVEVQDEGQGISSEDMKKLFGKFARLSARPTGGEHSTGLGLSIVKKMVEAMNGKVWCESEVGDGLPSGATFIVELPSA